MKITEHGTRLFVPLPYHPSKLMNWKRSGDKQYLEAENNYVNRIVLGLPTPALDGQCVCKNTAGLMDFQIKDVNKLLNIPDYLNSNPMGLGKTVETIRYLQEQNAQVVLIVVPKIIREQWQQQLKVWAGMESRIFENNSEVTPGVWIVNYEKLRNPQYLAKFQKVKWEYLILDEAHRIKSRNSQQTKAVKRIKAAHHIALTGTPILRYVDDLWSILNFLNPMYSGRSYWAFCNYFCELEDTPWGTKIIGMTADPDRVEILNKLLSLVSVRNNSLDVAKGKTRETVRLPMTTKQSELYKNEKDLVLEKLPDNLTIANGAVLTLRLIQTTSWPGLFVDGEHGPKFEWILEKCKDNPEEKIVVFSKFEKTITALRKYLDENDVGCVTITGKNTPDENAASKRMFLTLGCHCVQVLAGTIGAMGQGYDGLQEVSHTMVFIDRDWSPELMTQAEDRLNRMGQTGIVNIYYLECSKSFDQYVGRVNRNKAADIREALKNDSVGI